MSATGSGLWNRLWMAVSGAGLVVLGLASVAFVGLLLLAVMLVLIIVLMADPGWDEVTYVNNTSHALRMYDGKDRYFADLAPFGSRTFGESRRHWTGGAVAKTADGRVVFSVDLTWDELKAQDYRIVIEEQGVPPPSSDGSTAPSLEPLATRAAPG
jgi:hypothetical protein